MTFNLQTHQKQQTKFGTKTCICVWLCKVLSYFSQQGNVLVAVVLLHVNTELYVLKAFFCPLCMQITENNYGHINTCLAVELPECY